MRVAALARAHERLLSAVLGGRLKECPWETLKAVYFGGSTDEACVRQLARWAKANGIELEAYQRRAVAGNKPIVYNVVKFRPPTK